MGKAYVWRVGEMWSAFAVNAGDGRSSALPVDAGNSVLPDSLPSVSWDTNWNRIWDRRRLP